MAMAKVFLISLFLLDFFLALSYLYSTIIIKMTTPTLWVGVFYSFPAGIMTMRIILVVKHPLPCAMDVSCTPTPYPH
jgi:hypothetical protein